MQLKSSFLKILGKGRGYLLLLLILLFCSTKGKAQDRHWVFAVQKDLEVLLNYIKFDQALGGIIRHDIGMSNNNYLTFGLGMHKFNTNQPFVFSGSFPSLNVLPENEFPLDRYVDISTDGRVGLRQLPTRDRIEFNTYFYVGFGKDWLHASKKWGLFTDLGAGINYEYKKMTGYNEVARFPHEEFNHTYFVYYGHAIKRGIWFSLNFNLDLTYYLTPKLGFGFSAYLRRPIGDDGLPSGIGLHLRYTY